ncbi:RING finger protein [Endozoicomonas sp.]|uniref:RING finger protein n=1 Tax=Endozoicomonas sp. TaxID=1892382 RepID=UPI00288694B2|nr:RING finger protein [Endozoicomonas sp.]
MDAAIGNTRRSAFQDIGANTRSRKLTGGSDQTGISELKDLGKTDLNVRKSMEVYGWHEGHKVFATHDLSGLKLIPNAGSMVFSGRGWRTCKVTGSEEVAQVMTVPFAISPDVFQASLHVPDYGGWSYGRLMYPEQAGRDYKIGGKALEEPPYYRPSQYLTIMDDLAAEMFHGGEPKVKGIAKTLYQVQHSLRNLIHSPDYSDRRLPEGQTVEAVADKLAVMLRDRDGDREVAKSYLKYVNQLPPAAFFKAMRLIATDQVNLMDSTGQSVPSSNLFHHSVFFNGDLIFASLLLEGNRDSEGLTYYWVKRKVQEAFKQIPKIDLSGVTSMGEAITRIHRQAGIQVERKLRQAYFQKLVHDEILSQPLLSQNSIENILSSLLELASETKGITSLLMALLPDMASIADLNQSVAEMLLTAMEVKDKRKLMLPIEYFRQSIKPEKLQVLIDQNIRDLDKHKADILSQPSTSSPSHNSQHTVLGAFCDQFLAMSIKQGSGNSRTDSATKPGAVSAGTQYHSARYHGTKISSGNHKLIESLYNRIAILTMRKKWDDLVNLITELKNREVRPKDRLIGAKNACRLVARLLQQQLANGTTDRSSVQVIFERLILMLPMINDYLSVKALRGLCDGRGYISKTVSALCQPRADQSPGLNEVRSNSKEEDTASILFIPLDKCISRQGQRAERINGIRAIRAYECSICLEFPSSQNKLRNHNTAATGEPAKNGHPGMPICKRCVTRVLETDPHCPACRVVVIKKDFVEFTPNH